MGMVSPKTEWGGHWESQTHLHPRPHEVWPSVLALQVHPELALPHFLRSLPTGT